MKITKFAHSRLLVENDGEVILFDPGVYKGIKESLQNEGINFMIPEYGHAIEI